MSSISPAISSFSLTYWDRLYTPFQSEPDAAPVRLIVRRVKPTPGSQLALFAAYSYHGCITDREGETLELEADHRHHAEIENAIRDLKYGVGLNHLPSGRFPANAAWLAVQVIAHNLNSYPTRTWFLLVPVSCYNPIACDLRWEICSSNGGGPHDRRGVAESNRNGRV